ncbi:DUF742 domain-containing protein [Nonomuraea lactucae]|uniref:DUF742 domain-containing protein n=1 Tax=Nonomuraea lactucae TaxID=2249762 RepID=UPI000DE2E71F|nr:DUF742 domain-containing protein [Nonomuraea lactucae]
MVNPHRDDSGLRLPDPRMIEVRQAVRNPRESDNVPHRPHLDVDDDVVRPFVITGGRTRPVDDRLRMETLVTATPGAASAPLGFERRHIVQICRTPLSVAEVSVSLKVPLGVARVLIADLVVERLLVVHAQIDLGAQPSRELLERIRDGVRAL